MTLKFIDLFAGLGGFHLALERLGHECVFASEKDKHLAKLYTENFNISIDRDITKKNISEIPSHDILCAGFPCQPFSKAGLRKGLDDEKNGSLFEVLVDILSYHKPSYFILENVSNLKGHNNGETWSYIQDKLEIDLGYSLNQQVLSPHQFGIPHHRNRFFIIGSKQTDLSNFKWPEKSNKTTSARDIISKNVKSPVRLNEYRQEVVNIWQDFLNQIPKTSQLPRPLWSMEFGATYPFENETPLSTGFKNLRKFRGSFGEDLSSFNESEILMKVPSYASKEPIEFPQWKKNIIRHNRNFYNQHKAIIDKFLPRIKAIEWPSYQKLEFNTDGERLFSKHILQFRGSGIRVKRDDFFPALVTIGQQVPYIGWEGRYITQEEGARLQNIDTNKIRLPDSNDKAFKALGNSVNVEIIYQILERLLTQEQKVIEMKFDPDTGNEYKAVSQ